MIERAPHKLFAICWTLWFGSVLTALAMPDRPTFGLLVLLAFLPIEAVGVFVDTGARDTLSETATWLQRKLSKHRTFARGWNAMLLMVVGSIAYLLGRTVHTYAESWILAVAFGGLTVVWLWDHWVNVDRHG
jgi:hypothetical protein